MIKIENNDNRVYKFYNTENELLYVGITNNIKKRFKQHYKDKIWWNEIHSKHISEKVNRNMAHIYEIYYIANEKPKYNINFNDGGECPISLEGLKFKEHIKKDKNSIKSIGRAPILDTSKLTSLFESGMQIFDIAQHLKITKAYVSRRLVDLGLRAKTEPLKSLKDDILLWLKPILSKYMNKHSYISQPKVNKLITKQFSNKSARKFDYDDIECLMDNDLIKIRTNNIIKEQYKIKSKGYPFIFVKNNT